MQSSTLGMWKGYHLSMESYKRCTKGVKVWSPGQSPVQNFVQSPLPPTGSEDWKRDKWSRYTCLSALSLEWVAPAQKDVQKMDQKWSWWSMTVPQEIIIQRLSSEPNSKQPLVSTKGPFATNINQIPHRKDKVSSLMLRCGCGSLLRSPGGGIPGNSWWRCAALQGGKTFCASFCASLIAGSRRAFLTVFVCCLSSEWNARGANVCSL